MPNHEIDDSSEDSDQYDSGTESQGETDSEADEWQNHPSLKTTQLEPSATTYGSLSNSEGDTSQDHSSESDLDISPRQNRDKPRRSYKRRRYRANVRAKINKAQSTVEWLCYVGACDAHHKLVDNWGGYLQDVMWCRPQPHDIAQIELAEKPKLSRTARRRQNRELAQQQKEADIKEKALSEHEHGDLHPAPEHFKSYTTGERKVAYTKAQRKPTNESRGVYDGPAVVKEIELAEPGEESKPVFIAQDLTEIEEKTLILLLKEFRDIFAWTYHDMKGVPPSVVQHTIPLISTAKPVQQRPYPMNPKYAKIVQEEIEKLIKCGFIYPIEHSEWVSPIVIVPKKNGKLRVCVDLKKVNAAT